MIILITGANGQLGTDLVKVLQQTDTVVPFTHADVDITDFNTLKEVCFKHRPECL